MTENIRTKISRGSLNQESLMEVEVEKIEMELNTESEVATGLLIQRLTELYENPIQATIRETVSNALDAVALNPKGKERIVEVSTPTELNSVFKVKDNGVGMSYEDLTNVYAKYGASTKMDNFDQIGAYGLGAKAPLAYGTEFTVSSTKDGMTTTVIVAREENNNYLKIIESKETNDESGTTVFIPVSKRDIGEFKYTIEEHYKKTPAFEDVKLLVNSEEVKNDDFVLVDDKVLLLDLGSEEENVYTNIWVNKESSYAFRDLFSEKYDEDLFGSKAEYLLGGWMYQTPYEANKKSSYRGSRVKNREIIVELKPGIVSFNSSRDSILKSERYEVMEELLINHLNSEEFLNKVAIKLKEESIENFVKAFNSISLSPIKTKDGEMFVEIKKGEVHFPFSKFEHEGLGEFKNMQEVISSLNIDKKTSVVLEKNKLYKKQLDNVTFEKKDDSQEYSDLSSGSVTSIAEIYLKMDEVFNGTIESDRLDEIFTLFLRDQVSSKGAAFIVITGVDMKDEKEYKKAQRSRRSIFDLYSKEEYNVKRYIAYTESDKEVFDKIKELGLWNVIVKDVKEVEKEIAKSRAEKKAKEKVEFSPTVSTLENGELKEVDFSEVLEAKESGLKVVIVGTSDKNYRAKYVSFAEATENMVAYKYFDKDKSKFKMFITQGNHRVSDLKEVEKVADYVFRSDMFSNVDFGSSKLYDEMFKEGISTLYLDPTDKNFKKDLLLNALIQVVHTRFSASKDLDNASGVISEWDNIFKELKKVQDNYNKYIELFDLELDESKVNLDFILKTITSDIDKGIKSIEVGEKELAFHFKDNKGIQELASAILTLWTLNNYKRHANVIKNGDFTRFHEKNDLLGWDEFIFGNEPLEEVLNPKSGNSLLKKKRFEVSLKLAEKKLQDLEALKYTFNK